MAQKQLQSLFQTFLKMAGKKSGYEEGCWNLDYASCYGGYRIVEMMENGGEHHPFISRRLSC